MKILFTDEFKRRFYKLPIHIQNLYYKQENVFKENWKDIRLHIKKLKGEQLTFSFRITRHYRVLFIVINNDTSLFMTIDHRKDIYRK